MRWTPIAVAVLLLAIGSHAATVTLNQTDSQVAGADLLDTTLDLSVHQEGVDWKLAITVTNTTTSPHAYGVNEIFFNASPDVDALTLESVTGDLLSDAGPFDTLDVDHGMTTFGRFDYRVSGGQIPVGGAAVFVFRIHGVGPFDTADFVGEGTASWPDGAAQVAALFVGPAGETVLGAGKQTEGLGRFPVPMPDLRTVLLLLGIGLGLLLLLERRVPWSLARPHKPRWNFDLGNSLGKGAEAMMAPVRAVGGSFGALVQAARARAQELAEREPEQEVADELKPLLSTLYLELDDNLEEVVAEPVIVGEALEHASVATSGSEASELTLGEVLDEELPASLLGAADTIRSLSASAAGSAPEDEPAPKKKSEKRRSPFGLRRSRKAKAQRDESPTAELALASTARVPRKSEPREPFDPTAPVALGAESEEHLAHLRDMLGLAEEA